MNILETLILNDKLPYSVFRDINRLSTICSLVGQEENQSFFDKIHNSLSVQVEPYEPVIESFQSVLALAGKGASVDTSSPLALVSNQPKVTSLSYNFDRYRASLVLTRNQFLVKIEDDASEILNIEATSISCQFQNLLDQSNISKSLKSTTKKLVYYFINQLIENAGGYDDNLPQSSFKLIPINRK